MSRDRYRILLVEDDPEDRQIVEDLIRDVDLWHPEVDWANSYEQGIERLRANVYDVALVDYRLGARLGLDFISESTVRASNLPVIILTGQSGPEVDHEAALAGAADFLPKRELNATLLERAVRYTVENRRRHKIEARFRALIENSRDLITILDLEGRIEYASPSLIRMLGFEPGEKVGADAMGEVHEEDVVRVRETFLRLASQRESAAHLQYRVRHRDGSWRVLDTMAQNLLHDPLIRGIVVNSWDITELRQTQDRMRFQAELLERVGQAVLAVDDSGNVTYWNEAAEQLTGYSAQEVLGKPIMALIVPPDDHAAAIAAREAARAGQRWDGEIRVRRRDGRLVVMQTTVTPATQPDGSAGGRIAVGADITELRRVQHEGQAAAERVRFQADLLAAVAQAVIAVDLEFRVQYMNRAAEELYHWQAEAAIGRNISEVVPTRDPGSRNTAILAALRRGESWTGEVEVLRADGSAMMVQVTNAPFINAAGELLGIIGVSTDVTDRRLLEEQLRQAQKMEAIGRLAGGVAHDFNNILTAIKGHTGMLLEELPPDAPGRPDALEIQRAAERAASLTRQLLAFSRKQVLEMRLIDLAAAVREIEPMVRRLVPERIELQISAESEAVVRADQGQLGQVLMNLVVNAADAIEDEGTVTVAVAVCEIGTDATEATSHGIVPGAYGEIVVRDTGVGMSRATIEHIYEPFFTTKTAGKGTGLGLPTVYGIVKQSGGYIIVDSELGVGSVFRVLLPRLSAPPDPAAEPAAQSLPLRTRRGGVILLVEDDPTVRALEKRVLERAGYQILEAVNGRRALELVEQHQGSIDVVLSDVVMPELGGVELERRLRERFPNLRVILTSGYSEAELRGEVRRAGAAFLVKPFTPQSLLEIISQTLPRS